MNTFSHELADGVYQFSTCHATALAVATAPTIRCLAGLESRTLAITHSSSTTAAARPYDSRTATTRSAGSKRGISP
jgi:hypothetical protein